MPISIAWSTGEISIPQVDLTFVGPGAFYRYDSDAFRKEVMDLYASTEGGPWPTPFVHNTEVVISGITQARQILVNDAYYFTTFEDLQYRVQIIGSNNNIHEVSTINQVSIEPTNSIGLVNVTQINEVHKVHGLDADAPMSVSGTQRTAGDITQDISEAGGTITVQRS